MNESQKLTEQLVDLTTIGAGAALEKFAAEMRAVIRNIRDPNTQPQAKRKIVLEFVFVPDEDREQVKCLLAARSVLASTKPTGEVMWIGTKDGEPVATVVHATGEDPRQGVLPLPSKEKSRA